jgi:uncharacterized protein YciI
MQGQTINENYDSTFAKSLRADDYGMKKYVLVMLKTGSNTSADQATQDSLFVGHMKNINRLADNGSLILAGPFVKNDRYQGLFILNVETFEEAKRLLETDPAINYKLLDADLFIWYGTAAVQEIPKIHKKLGKIIF